MFGEGQYKNLFANFNLSPTPTSFDLSKKITRIASGKWHCLAQSHDGELYTWGYKSSYKVKSYSSQKFKDDLVHLAFGSLGNFALDFSELEIVQRDFIAAQIHL